jgi:formylglycine-generating enzyme required for sulfatase activity
MWSSIGWSWKQRYNSGAGLDGPLGWESVLAPVRIGNHPVNVIWYEAAAFARWLEHLRRDGSLRLPLNVPGDTSSPGELTIAAVTSTSTRRSTTTRLATLSTGYYRRGHLSTGSEPELDLYDLSGNVSEWCLTCWDEAGYRSDNDAQAGCHCVSRGGHYHNGARVARPASRTWGRP